MSALNYGINWKYTVSVLHCTGFPLFHIIPFIISQNLKLVCLFWSVIFPFKSIALPNLITFFTFLTIVLTYSVLSRLFAYLFINILSMFVFQFIFLCNNTWSANCRMYFIKMLLCFGIAKRIRMVVAFVLSNPLEQDAHVYRH